MTTTTTSRGAHAKRRVHWVRPAAGQGCESCGAPVEPDDSSYHYNFGWVDAPLTAPARPRRPTPPSCHLPHRPHIRLAARHLRQTPHSALSLRPVRRRSVPRRSRCRPRCSGSSIGVEVWTKPTKPRRRSHLYPGAQLAGSSRIYALFIQVANLHALSANATLYQTINGAARRCTTPLTDGNVGGPSQMATTPSCR